MCNILQFQQRSKRFLIYLSLSLVSCISCLMAAVQTKDVHGEMGLSVCSWLFWGSGNCTVLPEMGKGDDYLIGGDDSLECFFCLTLCSWQTTRTHTRSNALYRAAIDAPSSFLERCCFLRNQHCCVSSQGEVLLKGDAQELEVCHPLYTAPIVHPNCVFFEHGH